MKDWFDRVIAYFIRLRCRYLAAYAVVLVDHCLENRLSVYLGRHFVISTYVDPPDDAIRYLYVQHEPSSWMWTKYPWARDYLLERLTLNLKDVRVQNVCIRVFGDLQGDGPLRDRTYHSLNRPIRP